MRVDVRPPVWCRLPLVVPPRPREPARHKGAREDTLTVRLADAAPGPFRGLPPPWLLRVVASHMAWGRKGKVREKEVNELPW